MFLTPDAQDKQAVEQVVEHFIAAWNQHNAATFASLFSEASEWVNVLNQLAQGRQAIEDMHVYPFTTTLKAATLQVTQQRARWLREDIAVVDLQWENTGAQTPDGRPLPTRYGLLTMILCKQDGQWWITIGHNVDYTGTYKRTDFEQL